MTDKKLGRKPQLIDIQRHAWSIIRAVASGEGLLADKAKALLKEKNRQRQLKAHYVLKLKRAEMIFM